ncbi:hypothetical protein CC79DRAFT_1355012 [Sarocladium strictum]
MTLDRGSTDHSTKGIAKKPISARRRLQNREAQKAYRDRRRERLQELEGKVASLEGSRNPLPANSQEPALRRHPVSNPDDAAQLVDQSQQAVLVPEAEITSDDSLFDPSNKLWDDASLWLDPVSLGIASPHATKGKDDAVIQEPHSSANLATIDAAANTHPDPSSFPFLVGGSWTPDSTTQNTSSKTKLKLNTSSMSIYRPSSNRRHAVAPRLVRDCFLSLSRATNDSLQALAKSGDFSFVDIVQSLLQVSNLNDSNSDGDSHSLTQNAMQPPIIQALIEQESYSPYRNVLRISRFSYFAALFANSSSLGFDFSMFLNETSVSPFYGQSDVDIDKSTPLSLRPLDLQRTVRHHPYLDTLPFPTLRRRALAALSTNPPLLESDDLCLDLMLNDGLTCWGSTNPHGSDHGTPWESQSWEASGWFLQKWWWLIGGEDGELWRSSQWWASQRGERIVPWPSTNIVA